jgi:hypothetical protein
MSAADIGSAKQRYSYTRKGPGRTPPPRHEHRPAGSKLWNKCPFQRPDPRAAATFGAVK